MATRRQTIVRLLPRGVAVVLVLGAAAACAGGGGSGPPLIEVATYGVGAMPVGTATYSYDGPTVGVEPVPTAWRFQPGADVDREQLDRIGATLDVGSAQITVTSNGAVEWFASTGQQGWECSTNAVVNVDAGFAVEQAAAPCAGGLDDPLGVDVATGDEIRGKALELFAEMGIATDGADVSMPDAQTVVVRPLFEGAPSPLAHTIGFTLSGDVLYASGYLGVPEQVTGYAGGNIAEAIGWLNRGWSELGWDALAPRPGSPDTGSADAAAPVCPKELECSGLPPAPSSGDVVVDTATPALLRLDGADGTVWLVPAWNMRDSAGLDYQVPALAPASFRLVDGNDANAPWREDARPAIPPPPAVVPNS